jgi:fumarylacetoacetate (FAA) hydrolase
VRATKLASLDDGTRDGRLLVVSADGRRCVDAADVAGTLQEALERWDSCAAQLEELYVAVSDGEAVGRPIEPTRLLAPLPRSHQWAEGSTYLAHMERLRAARGLALPPDHARKPVVYQTGSDRFLTPTEPIPAGGEDWGLDVEATIAVVTDDVPAGTTAADAAAHVKLVVLANDLTFRHVLPVEMAKGVGLYLSKPARPFAPFAITPAALGAAWVDGRLSAAIRTAVNDDPLGAVRSDLDQAFGFGEVIAHMTQARSLAAGTLVGSGTVANRVASHGFGCIAERRALQAIDGALQTPFLRPGDRIRMEAVTDDGGSPFGAMEQTVVASRPAPPPLSALL